MVEDLKQQIWDYVIEVTKETDKTTIRVDTRLFEEGHLDSMGYVKLLAFIEDLRGQPIPDELLNMCNFASIETMMDNLF